MPYTTADALKDFVAITKVRHSAPFLAGFRSTFDVLTGVVEEEPVCPYEEGTAEADAYWAGQDAADDFYISPTSGPDDE